MKKALIDSRDNRVVQVADEEFPTHESLYWVDCPDDTGSYYIYDPENLTFEDPHAHTKDEFGNPVEPFNMQRMRAYPPMGEQLDMLFKEIRDTGTISTDGNWFNAIQSIKDAIPKPIDPTLATQHLNSDGTVAKFYENIVGVTTGVGKNATFKVRKGDTGIQVAVVSPGLGYVVNDSVVISGADIEESLDITVSVTSVDNAGGIALVTVA